MTPDTTATPWKCAALIVALLMNVTVHHAAAQSAQTVAVQEAAVPPLERPAPSRPAQAGDDGRVGIGAVLWLLGEPGASSGALAICGAALVGLVVRRRQAVGRHAAGGRAVARSPASM